MLNPKTNTINDKNNGNYTHKKKHEFEIWSASNMKYLQWLRSLASYLGDVMSNRKQNRAAGKMANKICADFKRKLIIIRLLHSCKRHKQPTKKEKNESHFRLWCTCTCYSLWFKCVSVKLQPSLPFIAFVVFGYVVIFVVVIRVFLLSIFGETQMENKCRIFILVRCSRSTANKRNSPKCPQSDYVSFLVFFFIFFYILFGTTKRI